MLNFIIYTDILLNTEFNYSRSNTLIIEQPEPTPHNLTLLIPID